MKRPTPPRRHGLGALLAMLLLVTGGQLVGATAATAALPTEIHAAIVGPARVGAVLSLTHDAVPTGTDVSYEWLVDDGTARWELGTGRSVRVPSDALDGTVVGVVTLDDGDVWRSWEVETGTVATGRLSVTPRVRGSGAAGSPIVLTTTVVDESGQKPLGFLGTHVQWLREGTPIVGRTGTRFYSSAADYGHRVWARITVTSPSYVTVVVDSPRTTIPRHTAARSRVAVSLRSPKARTVRVRVTVTAPGVRPTGTVLVRRGARSVARATLKGGRATLVLKRQRPGKARYLVTYTGGPGVLPGVASAAVKVRR